MTDKKQRRRGHHEGTSYHRPDGRWEWKETLPDGRRSFYGKTEREARRKAKAALKDYEDGLSNRGEKLTMRAYLTSWLDDTARDRVRPSTMQSYQSHIDHHIIPAIGGIHLRELTGADVNRMLAVMVRKGVSPATANRVRATLRTALTSAVKAQMVRTNAASFSDARTERRKRITPLTADQARQLIEATKDDRMGPLIAVALATGMRQGELLALRWSDIDLDYGVIHIRRTLTWADADPGDDRKRCRCSPIPRRSNRRARSGSHDRQSTPSTGNARCWLRWNNSRRWIAGSRCRMRISSSPRRMEHRRSAPMSRIGSNGSCKDAGLPRQRFHDLRHATASLLLAEGVDLFTVKEILGHSQIALTANTYGHLTDKLADDAAVRLDRVFGDDSLTTKLTTEPIDSDDTKETTE